MEVKYYVCNHCGNIIEMVKDQGVPVMCCGEAMHELKAGVTDAAVEKHVPVYTVDKQHVHVVVGETKHPMLDNHFIEWITLNTNQGIYRKQLIPGQEPIADFCLCDGEYVEDGEIIALRALNVREGVLDLTDIKRIKVILKNDFGETDSKVIFDKFFVHTKKPCQL